MANNRLWLVHRPSGRRVFLGKRMAWGWYGAPEDTGARLNAMFEAIECDQDDFELVMEDASRAPCATESQRVEHDESS